MARFFEIFRGNVGGVEDFTDLRREVVVDGKTPADVLRCFYIGIIIFFVFRRFSLRSAIRSRGSLVEIRSGDGGGNVGRSGKGKRGSGRNLANGRGHALMNGIWGERESMNGRICGE